MARTDVYAVNGSQRTIIAVIMNAGKSGILNIGSGECISNRKSGGRS